MHILGEVILQENQKHYKSAWKDMIELKKVEKKEREQEKALQAKAGLLPKEAPLKVIPPAIVHDPSLDEKVLLGELRKTYTKLHETSITTLACAGGCVFSGDKDGYVNKISIAKRVPCQKLGFVHKDTICAMTVSPDGQFLFTSDPDGILKQTNIWSSKLEKNYGRIHDSDILALCVSPNNHLFTADYYGTIKQIDIAEKKEVMSWGKVHKTAINTMKCSPDGDYLFTADGYSYVHQHSLQNRTCIKNYGYLHDSSIKSIVLSQDGKYFFTSDINGCMKQFSIKDKQLVKDYGKIHEGKIASICCSPSYLFTSDDKGTIKQWCIETRELAQTFDKVHEAAITAMCVSENARNLFSADVAGNMLQFVINDAPLEEPKTAKLKTVEPLSSQKAKQQNAGIDSFIQQKVAIESENKKSDIMSVMKELKEIKENRDKIVSTENGNSVKKNGGVSKQNGSANGHSNGNSNGHSNGNAVVMSGAMGTEVKVVSERVDRMEKRLEKMDEKVNRIEDKLDLLVTHLVGQKPETKITESNAKVEAPKETTPVSNGHATTNDDLSKNQKKKQNKASKK